MQIFYINFESFSAYSLYLYIKNILGIKITPCYGMTITEKMMLDALEKILK